MDKEKALEIHDRCNSWFYGFDSTIHIIQESCHIGVKFEGVIEIEQCRINLGMFVLEILEDVRPSTLDLDFSGLDIRRNDFLEVIIEIAFVLYESKIDFKIIVSKKVEKYGIFREYKNIFESIGKVDVYLIKSINSDFTKVRNKIDKYEIIKNWENEFMISTMNTEQPGIEYTYHHRVI